VTVAGQSFSIGGDIIVKADGSELGSSVGKLENIIAAHKPGDRMTLDIYRDGKMKAVTVTLGTRS
jgi:serine protease Do